MAAQKKSTAQKIQDKKNQLALLEARQKYEAAKQAIKKN